jgi:hypothetical protein
MREHPEPKILVHERRVGLDHDDLAGLIEAIVNRPQGPVFGVVYAVSDNDERLHDPFDRYGWLPQHSSAHG